MEVGPDRRRQVQRLLRLGPHQPSAPQQITVKVQHGTGHGQLAEQRRPAQRGTGAELLPVADPRAELGVGRLQVRAQPGVELEVVLEAQLDGPALGEVVGHSGPQRHVDQERVIGDHAHQGAELQRAGLLHGPRLDHPDVAGPVAIQQRRDGLLVLRRGSHRTEQ